MNDRDRQQLLRFARRLETLPHFEAREILYLVGRPFDQWKPMHKHPWLWQGAVNQAGRPVCGRGPVVRVMWELLIAPIEPGVHLTWRDERLDQHPRNVNPWFFTHRKFIDTRTRFKVVKTEFLEEDLLDLIDEIEFLYFDQGVTNIKKEAPRLYQENTIAKLEEAIRLSKVDPRNLKIR